VDLLGRDVAGIGGEDRQQDGDGHVGLLADRQQEELGHHRADEGAAGGRHDELDGRVQKRERPRGGRAERDAEPGQSGGVVDQRLALDQPPHPLGDAHGAERRDRRHRVRRRDHRTEHERGGPRHAVYQGVRGQRHEARGGEHERQREKAQRAALGPQLACRRGPAGAHQQRRHEHQQHHVRLQLHAGHARDERQRRAGEHQHDRERDAQPVGSAHEQYGREQQREEKLELTHRWRAF
jgi:hypothetical protein